MLKKTLFLALTLIILPIFDVMFIHFVFLCRLVGLVASTFSNQVKDKIL